MADMDHTSHGMPQRDAVAIAALAEETQTDATLVQCLFEEELETLEAQSSVKSFIGLIAARRVRDRLKAAPNAPARTQSTPRAARRTPAA
ncbi:MAG: DUF3562 domain-containing protein [Gammaproteobacteria bacterium]|nr:DUF3562 domain-containing protein [Gammaproteobacteria bacterium]MBV8307241.1 DUF3562 domain-containing protein [Gammaproteobacteria bacterium]MBV8403361.1 DUF3562 domain-containing protein [Gammaproteobacteria bacterium]